MNTSSYFLIDFDSTCIQTEGLEELAAIALKMHPQKKFILQQMKTLTEKGMNGSLPFAISLKERIKLLQASESDIRELIKILKKKISPSILRNKKFFSLYKDNIYIISGGFKEFIVPVVSTLDISPEHVFANTFLFDKKGTIIGIDENNVLAQDGGKAKLIKSLKLKGTIISIGDGYTDYILKEAGIVKKFIAFTENVARESVTKNADYVAHTFDDVLSWYAEESRK